MSPSLSRLPWQDDENKKLILLWERINSVYMVAIIMKRSMSSVQTQASRLGLPPRRDISTHSRRRWTEEEDVALVDAVNKSETSGEFDIQAVADKLDRSVDAVFSRIESLVPNAGDIRERIYISSVLGDISLESYVGLNAPPSPSPKRGKISELIGESRGKVRKCLQCEKDFWSEGAHNRVCTRCKRSEDWGE